jgi:NADPH:quinone reductase-like Zn-dependent oxidoreductase/malonyl CoA-acyl carrier protein transacylase
MQSGLIDRAIVAGVSLNLRPVVSKVFQKYNMLSPDGTCHSFDDNANGYCRSETINAVILQREHGYVRIIGHGINANGTTEQGITFPNVDKQTDLFNEVCSRFQVDKTKIEYIEAHGTGTTAGDNVEITALNAVYGSDDKCVHLGSIKSSMGHAEGASGLNSVIKCLMSYELGELLPNIHYHSTSHKPILDGRFKVVDEITPFHRGYAVVNNFGFGGTNAHIILANGNYEYGSGREEQPITKVFARTKEGCEALLASDAIDNAFFANPADISKFPFSGAKVRGSDFSVIKSGTSVPKLAYIYSGQGCNYEHMAKELYNNNATFSDTVNRLHANLLEISSGEISLKDLMTAGDKWLDKRYSSIGITTVQIGITNILKENGYSPDYIIGHSMGEIGCSYVDECLTEYQCIHISYVRSKLVERVNSNAFFYIFDHKLSDAYEPLVIVNGQYTYQITKTDSVAFEAENTGYINKVDNMGRMVFVSATEDVATEMLKDYPNVRIACFNSIDGLTLSGPHEDVCAIEVLLAESKTFFKPVMTDGIAYHSVLMRPYFDHLMGQFATVMPEPKARSTKWLSTSDSTNPLCDSLYHTTNIVSSVLFSQQIQALPKDENIVFLEISPNEGMLGQVKRTRPENSVLVTSLSKKTTDENSTDINKMLCNLWANKCMPVTTGDNHKHLSIDNRYKIRWDHGEMWKIVTYKDFEGSNSNIEIQYNLSEEHKFLLDHQIQGKSLFPAMGHLYTIWMVYGLDKPLHVRDFHIFKAVVMNDDMKTIQFSVNQTNTGYDIYYDGEMVAKCDISLQELSVKPFLPSNYELTTNKHMFYGLLSRYGYEYKNTFRMIDLVSDNSALIGIANHWITFLDGMLQTSIQSVDGLYLPTKIHSVSIKTPAMSLSNQRIIARNKHIYVESGDVIIHGLETTLAPSLVDNNESVKDAVVFVPYHAMNVANPLSICAQIVNENIYNMSVLEVGDQLRDVKALVNSNSLQYSQDQRTDKVVDFVFGASLNLDNIYDQLSVGGFALTTDRVSDNSPFLLVASYNDAYFLYRKVNGAFDPVVSDNLHLRPNQTDMILTTPSDGFVKSINKEPDTNLVICTHGDSEELVAHAKNTQLRVSIMKDGVCGSYRRVPHHTATVSGSDFEIKIEKPGTLQTLTRYETVKGDLDVHYTGLNFKDVMLSYGKLKVPPASIQLGLEFSGKHGDKNIMGMGLGMFKSSVHSSNAIYWEIPEQWSLEEASTIPCVYATVYYALEHKCGMSAGSSILIHAGAGGIGQTAIHLCLKRGLRVFTTCSENKRQFLKDKFGLADNQIGNSRDNSFYDWIMDETNGEGVDIVLNSLAEEKLRLSIDCVKAFGQFCEIGKFDILQNNPVGLKAMENNVSLHVIDLSTMFSHDTYKVVLRNLIQSGLDKGEIVPLNVDKVFHYTELEQAIRYMGGGNHIGKIVIKMKDDVPTPMDLKSRFHTTGTHLITGGMGGFGMELGEWLVKCGATKVLLMGRNGISNLYQSTKFKKYSQFEYVCGDITDEQSVASVFATYAVAGVWHLAMKLEDKLYANMSTDDWNSVINVKYNGAVHLDKYCPANALFVCWSSISSLFGNAGQTNYAQGNFLMEEVCRTRRANGKHGLSVCWGAIDNIGYLSQENAKINKLMFIPQNIDDCLNDLHAMLKTDEAVVSCYKLNPQFGEKDDASEATLLESVIFIIGFSKDAIANMDKNVTLQELGMDSLQSASVKQILKNNGKTFENIYNVRLCDL